MSMSSTALTLGTSSLAFFLLGFLLWQLAECGVRCRQLMALWDVDLNELYATVLRPPPNNSPTTLNCACGFKRIREVCGGGIASKMLSAEFQNLHPSRARPSPTLHYLLSNPPNVFCYPSKPPHGPTDQFRSCDGCVHRSTVFSMLVPMSQSMYVAALWIGGVIRCWCEIAVKLGFFLSV